MPMLAAVTCVARRRRMHCRSSGGTTAALELELRREQQQHGADSDQRHRWQAGHGPEKALHGLSTSRLDRQRQRASAHAASIRQGPDSGWRRQTVAPAGTEHQAAPAPVARRQPGSSSSAAAVLEQAPAAGGDERSGTETGSAPSSEAAAPSSLLCAVCLEEVRGRGEEAEATTLPCSHSYQPGCVLPWLAAHRACPCCRATVPSPESRY